MRKRREPVGRCIECVHATLKQTKPGDPKIITCAVSGERQVAEVHRCTEKSFLKQEKYDDEIILRSLGNRAGLRVHDKAGKGEPPKGMARKG